jgi:hypothetical protein
MAGTHQSYVTTVPESANKLSSQYQYQLQLNKLKYLLKKEKKENPLVKNPHRDNSLESTKKGKKRCLRPRFVLPRPWLFNPTPNWLTPRFKTRNN